MKLDVVIVSKNRPLLLNKCLQSLNLAMAQVQNIEFLIRLGLPFQDNLLLDMDVPFKIQKFSDSLTPPEKRNQLVSVSSADWIFFCDDDVEVPVDIFQQFFTLQELHPLVSVLGGPNLTDPLASEEERWQGRFLSSRLTNPFFCPRYSKKTKRETLSLRYFCLCNIFIKNSPSLRFTHTEFCGEELQLLHELKRQDKRFLYSPSLWVFHCRRKTREQFYQQIFSYGRGRGLYWRKNFPRSANLISFFLWFLPSSKNLFSSYLNGLRQGLLISSCTQISYLLMKNES